MWKATKRHTLLVSASLGLVLAAFALLLLVQGHPLLIAWRGEPSIYVPYWNTFQRPPEVFNGWPTVGKFDGAGLNYVRVSDGAASWWNLWIEPAVLAGMICALEIMLVLCLVQNYRTAHKAPRGFDVGFVGNDPPEDHFER